MARIAVTFTVLFSVFILSNARIPFSLPSTDVAELKPTTISSESETKDAFQKIIRLPSKKSESEALEIQKLPDSETSEIKDLPESNTIEIEDLPKSDTNTITTIGIARPLTVTYDVSFRPINRHFHHMRVNRPFWSRFPHRCRHHGKPNENPKLEISYGNDMLMSDKTNFDPMFVGDDLRQISGGIADFHGEKRRFPFRPHRVNDGWLTERGFKMPRHVEDKEEMVAEDQEKGGFLKPFAKFFNRF